LISKPIIFSIQPIPNDPSPQKRSPLEKLAVAQKLRKDRHENIYTLPNLITLSRIATTPFIGYFILQGNFIWATSLLFYAGVSDLVHL
jgi:cardiolipin synthase